MNHFHVSGSLGPASPEGGISLTSGKHTVGFSLLLLNHLSGICLPAVSCNSPAGNQGAAYSLGKKFPNFSSSVSEAPI